MSQIAAAYISGALSSAPGKVRLETFYEGIGKICEKQNIASFIPHRDALQENQLHLPPYRLYQLTMDKISESDLLIAYVGYPSIGVGMEIHQACQNCKDIILLYDSNCPISKPMMGLPMIFDYVGFSEFNDAYKKLRPILEKWVFSKKNEIEALKRSNLALN